MVGGDEDDKVKRSENCLQAEIERPKNTWEETFTKDLINQKQTKTWLDLEYSPVSCVIQILPLTVQENEVIDL